MASYNGENRIKVRVLVRTRPTAKFAHDVIKIEKDNKTMSIHLPKNTQSDQLRDFINNQQLDWSFKVDKVLQDASQEEVYLYSTKDLVSRVLDGYNATVMAFGQTGAGKTYTMTGMNTSFGLRGIIPRAVSQLFMNAAERQEYDITVRLSYLEIYNDTIHDLLSTLPDSGEKCINPMNIETHGPIITEDKSGCIHVKGVSVKLAKNEEDALNMFFEGEMNRSIAEHSLNLVSSRSHCIFTLHVESRSHTHSTATYTVSKLNLIDLAGSERLGKTNSEGKIMREAMYINKSLTFLEQVTRALTERNRDHIPYRQCKLTHLLKDAIGGNCSTVMIANVWPEMEHIEETLSTLRFSTRMMRVSNNPNRNIMQDAELLMKEHEEEIKTLRMELALHDTMVGKSSASYMPLSEVELQDIDQQIRLYVNGIVPELEIKSVRQVKEIFSRFKLFLLSPDLRIVQDVSSIDEGTRTLTEPVTSKSRASTVTKTKKGQHKNVSSAGSEVEVDGPQQSEKVGENEGVGFAIGTAPPEVKHSSSPVCAVKKLNKFPASVAFSIKNKETTEDDHSSLHSGSEERSQTPPPKEEEFEKFKKGRGLKINEIFLSNKEQLQKKKKECTELASEINRLKRNIDKEREYLNKRKSEREAENILPLTTDTGELILDEGEFAALTHLKQLKCEYREKYQSLQVAQACLKTLNQYVEKSRSKLLTEFNEWYRICYIGAETMDDTEEDVETSRKNVESEFEKFDRLQNTLLNKDPSTAAFYNAQLRTERRFYSLKQQRRHGESVATVKNKPPGIMTFT